MRIGIDLRRLHDTGIGRYSGNLTRAILAQDMEDEFVLILGHADDAAGFESNSRKVKCITSPARRYSLQELVSPLLIAGREKIDLLHVPHQFHFPFGKNHATVITVMDLIQILYPTSPTAQQVRPFYTKFLRLACMRADRVCAISIAAQKSISTTLGIPMNHISVNVGAVDPMFDVEPSQELVEDFRIRKCLPPHNILYVGMWKPHKNLVRLVQAFAVLLREYHVETSVGLVIVGQPDPQNGPLIRQTAEELGITQDVYFLGRLSDADLRLVYSLADVFVQPSLCEGFGLTLLEAMACGTPVVASRIPPHEEVAGGAALLVDPFSASDIAQAIHRVLGDRDLAEKMSRSGLRNVNRFSWERAARETLTVYNEVMSNRSRKPI